MTIYKFKETIMQKLLVLMLVWSVTMVEAAVNDKNSEAIFAAGCFWCIQEAFHKMDGVISTEVGYTGGRVANPTYEQVSKETTGHREAIRVVFDPKVTSYEKLLVRFWQNVDALDDKGQFCDKGESYKSAIYYNSNEQKSLANTSKEKISELMGQKVVTDVTKASKFYSAEDYHQQYHLKNPLRYKYYKFRCGRTQRLEQLWGKVALEFWESMFYN